MPIDKSRPPAVALLRKLGMEPDPWQVEVLDGDQPRLLLNCSRQAGKSTVVAMLGLAQAMFVPGTKVLLVSRSHRQSKELFGIVAEFYRRFNKPMFERADGLPLDTLRPARLFLRSLVARRRRLVAHPSSGRADQPDRRGRLTGQVSLK